MSAMYDHAPYLPTGIVACWTKTLHAFPTIKTAKKKKTLTCSNTIHALAQLWSLTVDPAIYLIKTEPRDSLDYRTEFEENRLE